MDKEKILQLFEEVLENWERAEAYVIQDTFTFETTYTHDSLVKDVNEIKAEFLQALDN